MSSGGRKGQWNIKVIKNILDYNDFTFTDIWGTYSRKITKKLRSTGEE